MVTYICPMHPEIRRESAGRCPECGMNLVPSKGAYRDEREAKAPGVYDKHAGHRTNIFKRKFWVSLVLTLPVLAYSELAVKLFGWMAPSFRGSQYLAFVFGSIVFFYGGWMFILGAWRELRARLPGMMTLIAIATSAAYGFSVYVTFTGGEHALYWELTTLITVMLLGHWMEMKAVAAAQASLSELSKLLPDTAEVIRGSQASVVPLAELAAGDRVLVRPGGTIPADGAIIEGESSVNESLVTGESRPVAKAVGSSVIAGTLNNDGALTLRITNIGEHTFLAGILRLVAEAQQSKSRLQLLSDRAALYLTIFAVFSGVLTLGAWLAARAGVAFALERFVAVLVIACPHALGLAIPLVATISTALAARNGFLVRRRLALEGARNVDVVLFDKTGTLTSGAYGVEKVWPLGAKKDEREVLQLAASVDAKSEHSIGHAVVQKATADNIPLLEVQNFERIPGKGVRALVLGRKISVGGFSLADGMVETIPQNTMASIQEEAGQGKTIMFVLEDNVVCGAIALGDVIREESRDAVRTLKRMGLRVAMITGDSEDVARWVAAELAIDEYVARVLPQEKSARVKDFQMKGFKVMMVGDGINDAPALTQADVGIAIGAGTNVAIESAGIILVRNDPRDIAKIIRLSRLTYSKMMQNLFWATGYNVVALPLAAGVLAPYGILLQPAFSAVLMSLSTVIVALNALLLRRVSLETGLK